MNCELHLISQTNCRRIAAATRITSTGRSVHLCSRCDAVHGHIVGTVVSAPPGELSLEEALGFDPNEMDGTGCDELQLPD